jgi:hypothetical protein
VSVEPMHPYTKPALFAAALPIDLDFRPGGHRAQRGGPSPLDPRAAATSIRAVLRHAHARYEEPCSAPTRATSSPAPV